MRVLVAGPDPTDVGSSLADAGASIARLDGAITSRVLTDANVEDAQILIVTDPEEATGIPLARELNPDIEVVVYADESVPPFASHIADLIIDPAAISRSVLVEELLAEE